MHYIDILCMYLLYSLQLLIVHAHVAVTYHHYIVWVLYICDCLAQCSICATRYLLETYFYAHCTCGYKTRLILAVGTIKI